MFARRFESADHAPVDSAFGPVDHSAGSWLRWMDWSLLGPNVVFGQDGGGVRRPWLLVIGIAALVVGPALLAREGPRAAAATPVAEVTKRIAVQGSGNVAAAGGAVWTTNEKGVLSRIHPATNRVVAQIPLATRSLQFCCAAGFGAAWLADGSGDSVVRVAMATNAVVARIPVGRSPGSTAVGFGSVWVANNRSASVMRIDPGTNEVVATIRVGAHGDGRQYGNGPLALAIGGGSLWATVPNAGTVVRIDPRSNRARATLAARGQCALTARGNAVWAAGACGATTVSRIDAKAGRVAATRDLGDVPGRPAALGPHLWTVTFSGKLARLDARTLKPAGTMTLRGFNVEGNALAAGHGSLWVRAEGFVVRLAPR